MGPWRAKLEPLLRPSPVEPPDFYYNLLAPLAAKLDIWETEYLQVLEGEHAVKEYTKSHLALAAARRRWTSPSAAISRTPTQSSSMPPIRGAADGKTLFPFRRMFIIATAA